MQKEAFKKFVAEHPTALVNLRSLELQDGFSAEEMSEEKFQEKLQAITENMSEIEVEAFTKKFEAMAVQMSAEQKAKSEQLLADSAKQIAKRDVNSYRYASVITGTKSRGIVYMDPPPTPSAAEKANERQIKLEISPLGADNAIHYHGCGRGQMFSCRVDHGQIKGNERVSYRMFSDFDSLCQPPCADKSGRVVVFYTKDDRRNLFFKNVFSYILAQFHIQFNKNFKKLKKGPFEELAYYRPYLYPQPSVGGAENDKHPMHHELNKMMGKISF